MDLKNTSQELLSGNDNIVIIDNFQSIRGGRTLDVTGFTPEVIPAGHVIIQKDSDKTYYPMPVTADAYATTPVAHTIVGVLIASIPTKRPFAGIMVRGTVNVKAAPYKLDANTALKTALKTALPLIVFTHDKA